MSWHIYPAHYISHVAPTLANGWDAEDGYPAENINSLDDKQPWQAGSGTSGDFLVEFDRGHTTGAD